MNANPVAQQGLWKTSSRFLELFVTGYIFIYIFPFPLGDIPFVSELFIHYLNAIDQLTFWIGNDLLHISNFKKIEITGSGDTTFDYVKLISKTGISILLALGIFIYQLIRPDGMLNKMNSFVYTYARYFLGLYLFAYGYSKFYDGQFQALTFSRLDYSYGNSSPMGLLWTFMGYSKPYTQFTGFVEILAGLLLLFRRTTVIGALLSLMVMANVVMLNFAYDVPVKLFSSHLAFISVYILSPNLINLFNFFVLNKPSSLHSQHIELHAKWTKYSRILFKSILLLGISIHLFVDAFNQNNSPINHTMQGAYYTEHFVLNGDSLTCQSTDSMRWAKMYIERDYAEIVYGKNNSVYYKTTIDTSLHTIQLQAFRDTLSSMNLMYNEINDTTFLFQGQVHSDSLSILFKRKVQRDFPLMNNKFHWISDLPNNY